jgi:hypothetical protein
MYLSVLLPQTEGAATVCQFSSVEIYIMNRLIIYTLRRILLWYSNKGGAVFRSITPYSLVDVYQRLGRTRYLSYQDRIFCNDYGGIRFLPKL